MPTRNHPPPPGTTPFLAQLLFQPTRDPAPPCQGTAHPDQQAPPQASWEVRCYQDLDRLLALVQQGVEEAQATQIIWEEAGLEQDRRGVCLHGRRLPLPGLCREHHRPACWTRPGHLGDVGRTHEWPGTAFGNRSPHRAGRYRE